VIRDTVPSTTAPTSRSAILAPFHSPGGRFPHPGRRAGGHYPTRPIAASSTPRDRTRDGRRSGGTPARAWAPARARGPARTGDPARRGVERESGRVWSGQGPCTRRGVERVSAGGLRCKSKYWGHVDQERREVGRRVIECEVVREESLLLADAHAPRLGRA